MELADTQRFPSSLPDPPDLLVVTIITERFPLCVEQRILFTSLRRHTTHGAQLECSWIVSATVFCHHLRNLISIESRTWFAIRYMKRGGTEFPILATACLYVVPFGQEY